MPLRRTHPAWLVAIAIVLLPVLALAADFKAGVARRDITPREAVPMWGYGGRHAELSTGTLDPLHAVAIVLQAGESRLAIVGLDLGRSPAEASLQRIRARLKAELGIEHSLIAGSHTHHGPVLELADAPGKGRDRFDATLRYYAQLEDAIVLAVATADKTRVSAKIATGAVDLDGFNRNRQTKREPKPVDRTLTVLRLDRADTDQPLAVIVNFAAHPTSIPAQTMKFSADFVGATKATIEKEFGGMALFMQGAAGDLSANRGKKDYLAFGEALGHEAAKLAATLKPVAVTKPSLAVREERFRFEPRTNLNNPLMRMLYAYAFFPELVANFRDEYADGLRPRLTVALLNGDIALVGASGEFFCSHAIRLREQLAGTRLFFFGYCNGYHQYFPTIEATQEGGYGADTRVAPAPVGAGEELMKNTATWLGEMKAAAN
ncbi:MAG: neutral/alkaline non-lysosomal ceramidase N-terminal domain-containing protein [Verrucomicrobia bacterium]|nr:neutral/alkaline non-lysosomal ceramidase N-terminal domain-containing protein [Verrucomicrobiota bacterium]